jgi:predicted O-methyltransferase YrrM
MRDDTFIRIPAQYECISKATQSLSFPMASDLYTGSLLKTLAASKAGGRILELGTGSGLATSWILEGMDEDSKLISIDNNELLMSVAKQNLKDKRIIFICADGYEWISKYNGSPFDLIFADAMPGKYDLFEETWSLLKPGGFYIIDDMLPQPNWPEGHATKVGELIIELENREDIFLTKLNWSTGIIIAVKTGQTDGH